MESFRFKPIYANSFVLATVKRGPSISSQITYLLKTGFCPKVQILKVIHLSAGNKSFSEAFLEQCTFGAWTGHRNRKY